MVIDFKVHQWHFKWLLSDGPISSSIVHRRQPPHVQRPRHSSARAATALLAKACTARTQLRRHRKTTARPNGDRIELSDPQETGDQARLDDLVVALALLGKLSPTKLPFSAKCGTSSAPLLGSSTSSALSSSVTYAFSRDDSWDEGLFLGGSSEVLELCGFYFLFFIFCSLGKGKEINCEENLWKKKNLGRKKTIFVWYRAR